jgi:hypothetical protein
MAVLIHNSNPMNILTLIGCLLLLLVDQFHKLLAVKFANKPVYNIYSHPALPNGRTSKAFGMIRHVTVLRKSACSF